MHNRIVDFHVHAFPDKIAKKAAVNLEEYYHMPLVSEGGFGDILDRAERAGVEKMIIHSTATKAAQVENINNYVSGLVKEKPSLLVGFGTIHPDYTDYRDELQRVVELGLHGIKLHAEFQNFYLDDDKMLPIYEEIVRLGLPVLFHLGDRNFDHASPRRLANVLDQFPGMKAIGAHLGGVFNWDEAIVYLVGRDLYFDTSSTLHAIDPGVFLYIIRHHDIHKILFGTDYPLSDYELELKRFERLALTDEERELIFYKNAYRLLDEIGAL